MRLRAAILITKLLLFVLGLGLLGVAVFAFQLGLDHNPQWGKGRAVMAGLGGLLLALALGLQVGPALWSASARLRFLFAAWAGRVGSQMARILPGGVRSARAVQKIDASSSARARPGSRRLEFLAAGSGLLAASLVYLWYLTSGAMTAWTPYSTYFDRLANAFYHGQLFLLEQPPPELLALSNPYDYRNREGIGYLWDASLYQGRYYYYWGPVPALLALPPKLVGGPGVVVEDQYLVFALASGLNFVIALLLLRLRAVFFPGAPVWSVGVFVLLSGLSLPVLWLINRPSVYEVAIAGGQFFLFVGIYAALRSLPPAAQSGAVSLPWLLAAGLSWGAAVNSRLNLLAAVGFFTLALAWRALRPERGTARRLQILACLVLPLGFALAAMGWYNFARFGSVLENGHRYQLTGMALTGDYRDTVSMAYLLPNLYNYLLRPLQTHLGEFPFIVAPYIGESMWPWWIRLPENYYYAEPVAGLLPALPAVWLAALPLLAWVQRFWGWLNERPWPPLQDGDPPAPAWLWVWWVGGAACLLVPLLVFISSSMRYLADAAPALVVLSALGFWRGLLFARGKPFWRVLLGMGMALVVSLSIAMSLLANFTNGDKRFEANNPALYYALARFFQSWIQ